MAFIQEKQARSFTAVDLPDPVKINAKFVYNFFTPDERVNSKGDPRIPGNVKSNSTQRLIKAETLNFEVPRYVELNFSPGQVIEYPKNLQLEPLNISAFTIQNISSEETITNETFLSLRESDPDGQLRIREKVNALSDVLGLNFQDSDQTKTLSEDLGVAKTLVQQLISPYGKDSLLVNFKKEKTLQTLFDKASLLSLTSLINKRLAAFCQLGTDDISPLSRIRQIDKIRRASQVFLSSVISNDLTINDVEPKLNPIKIEYAERDDEVRIISAALIGYLVVRRQHTPSGRTMNASAWLLKGRESKCLIDTKIIYGSKYSYSVRNVYQIVATVSVISNGTSQKRKITFLAASRPSSTVTVLTEEFMAPNPPDGLFYKFDYDAKRGLILTWQLPAGRTRDVKYFQVFKRHSIKQPFECIAEIDFDDSVVKTLKRETVREDKIIEQEFPISTYRDNKFSRDSKPAIYAVCAIDAHGLTSGYSSQTQVGFDKNANKIILKSISRAGAPKQYPNFFTDPDLDDNIAVDSFSQDAIYDSGHSKVDIYFTPDAKTAHTPTSNTKDVLVTNQSQGKYKMHILNLDFQKSTVAEFKVLDLQKE